MGGGRSGKPEKSAPPDGGRKGVHDFGFGLSIVSPELSLVLTSIETPEFSGVIAPFLTSWVRAVCEHINLCHIDYLLGCSGFCSIMPHGFGVGNRRLLTSAVRVLRCKILVILF
jgi:hypothetical protein